MFSCEKEEETFSLQGEWNVDVYHRIEERIGQPASEDLRTNAGSFIFKSDGTGSLSLETAEAAFPAGTRITWTLDGSLLTINLTTDPKFPTYHYYTVPKKSLVKMELTNEQYGNTFDRFVALTLTKK